MYEEGRIIMKEVNYVITDPEGIHARPLFIIYLLKKVIF